MNYSAAVLTVYYQELPALWEIIVLWCWPFTTENSRYYEELWSWGVGQLPDAIPGIMRNYWADVLAVYYREFPGLWETVLSCSFCPLLAGIAGILRNCCLLSSWPFTNRNSRPSEELLLLEVLPDYYGGSPALWGIVARWTLGRVVLAIPYLVCGTRALCLLYCNLRHYEELCYPPLKTLVFVNSVKYGQLSSTMSQHTSWAFISGQVVISLLAVHLHIRPPLYLSYRLHPTLGFLQTYLKSGFAVYKGIIPHEWNEIHICTMTTIKLYSIWKCHFLKSEFASIQLWC